MKASLRPRLLVLALLFTFIVATWSSPIIKRDNEAAIIETPTKSYHQIIERDVVDLRNTGGSKTTTTTTTATSTSTERPPKPIPTTAPSTNPGISHIK
jgi:hypothetical protein